MACQRQLASKCQRSFSHRSHPARPLWGGSHCSVQPYSNEIAVSDKHKLLFTGHSRDLTSNPGIWIHKLARWHTRQADITHCMPTVLISFVLRCKTQCDYVRTLQSTPGSGLEAGNTQAHLRYLQLLASLLVILLFSSACLLGQASVCIMKHPA